MTNLTIYYIKDSKNEVVYTNTNSPQFAEYVNDYLVLGLGKYPTFDEIRENLDGILEVGSKQIEVAL